MDAKKLETKIIKEAIKEGSYELTGILETGEIVIAIVNPTSEKNVIEKYLDSKKISNEEKLEITKRFMKTKGRPAQELMQVYKQKCNLNYPRCKKNNLIERTVQEISVQEQSELINNGSKTLNQVRKEFSLEPIESGDILYHKRIL